MVILNSGCFNCADSASSFEKVELAVRMTRRMLKTRVDVGFFEVGKVLEDLVRRDPAGKISSTWLTVIRTARIVGSAAHTSGLIVIGSICMCLFYKNLRERNLISITVSARMC